MKHTLLCLIILGTITPHCLAQDWDEPKKQKPKKKRFPDYRLLSIRRKRAVDVEAERRKKLISKLCRNLHHTDMWIRANSAAQLGRLADKANREKSVKEDLFITLNELIDRLDDVGDRVRLNAVETLGKFGAVSAPAIPKLARLLAQDPHWNVRYAVAIAFGRIGRPSHKAVRIIADTIANPLEHESVRIACAETATKIGPRGAFCIPPLGMLLVGDKPSLRIAAGGALLQINQEALGFLYYAIGYQSNPFVRANAAHYLGKAGTRVASAVPLLRKAISDSHWLVRQQALEALKHVGPRAAETVAEVTAATTDPHPKVKKVANETLAIVTAYIQANRDAAEAKAAKLRAAEEAAKASEEMKATEEAKADNEAKAEEVKKPDKSKAENEPKKPDAP